MFPCEYKKTMNYLWNTSICVCECEKILEIDE